MLSPAAGDNLDRIVRNDDPSGIAARYIAAVGDPDYSRAFGIMLAHPTDAHFRMTEREAASVRVVSQVMAERAMSEGTTTAGGYGVPIVLDPTILLSSTGAINPIRQVARVFSISGSNFWKGVSGSVTAAFSAEGVEVAVVWFEREFDVPDWVPSGVATLTLGNVDDIDTTWVNGVKIGETYSVDVFRRFVGGGNTTEPAVVENG